jgi:hypothetical protein
MCLLIILIRFPRNKNIYINNSMHQCRKITRKLFQITLFIEMVCKTWIWLFDYICFCYYDWKKEKKNLCSSNMHNIIIINNFWIILNHYFLNSWKFSIAARLTENLIWCILNNKFFKVLLVNYTLLLKWNLI